MLLKAEEYFKYILYIIIYGLSDRVRYNMNKEYVYILAEAIRKYLNRKIFGI